MMQCEQQLLQLNSSVEKECYADVYAPLVDDFEHEGFSLERICDFDLLTFVDYEECIEERLEEITGHTIDQDAFAALLLPCVKKQIVMQKQADLLLLWPRLQMIG